MDELEIYLALRDQGLSHQEALLQAGQQRRSPIQRTAPTPQGTAPTLEPREEEGEGFLGATGEFAEGLGLGAIRAGTSLGEGTGWLMQRGGLPGISDLGEGLEGVSKRAEDAAENILTPEGKAGRAGELIGRIAGEVATTYGTLGLGRAVLPARALTSIGRATQGSRLRGAAGAALAESPLSFARAASWSQDKGTGFGTELALEIAGSSLGGAFMGSSARASSKMDIDAGTFDNVNSYRPSEAREGSGTLGRIGSSISKLARRGDEDRLLSNLERKYTGLVDEYYPLSQLGYRVGRRAGQEVDEQVAKMLGSSKAAELDLAQNMRPWLLKNKNSLDDISDAALVRREWVLRKTSKGETRRMDMEDDDLEKLYREIMGNPELVRTTNELRDFARKNLSRRHQAGIISDSEYKHILGSSEVKSAGVVIDDFYIPMLSERSVREGMDAPRGIVSKLRPQKGVDELKEGVKTNAKLESPISAIAYQTYRTFDDVARQRLGNTLSGVMEQGDELGLLQGITQEVVTRGGRAMTQEAIHKKISRGHLKKSNGEKVTKDDIYSFIDKGKEKHFLIEDRDLFNVLKGQSQEAQGILMELATRASTLKRNLITMVPDFSVLSILRDWPMFAVQRVAQRGVRGAIEPVAGGATGAAYGATTADTPQERVERALQFGLAGVGAGALARPGVEIAQGLGVAARGQLSEEGDNFVRRASAPLANVLGGLGDMLGMEKSLWQEFVNEGGLTAGVAFGSRSADDAAKVIRRFMRDTDPGFIGMAKKGPRFAADVLRLIGTSAENAPRIAQYRALTRGAQDKLPGYDLVNKPIWAAQDVTLPFGRSGSNKTVKRLNKITPFLNAQIQGWAKLTRLFRGDPIGRRKAVAIPGMLTTMGATITAPTVSLWMTNKDNPEYWDRPLWERNLFWLIPKPEGGFHRIPKPFELGYVFASVPERILDAMAMREASSPGSVPEASRSFASSAAPRGMSITNQVLETMRDFAKSNITGSVPVPAAFQPLIEQSVNRDLFRFKPIVPDYLQDRPAERQTTRTTPLLAEMIGQTMKDLTGVGISPLRVESIIQSVGGTTGRRAMQVVDAVGATENIRTPMSRLEPGERFSQITGAARFNTQQYDIGGIEYTSYTILARAKEKADELRRMERAGDSREEIDNYKEDYADELRIAYYTKKNLADMNELRQRRNRLLESETISQERLRNELDRVTEIGRRLGVASFRSIDNILR